jgi:hypothetical protein
MCLDTDSIQKLHDATTRLRELHQARAEWRELFTADPIPHPPHEAPLVLSLDEGERIFHSRIVAIEALLDELGWRRTIRVDAARAVEEPERV